MRRNNLDIYADILQYLGISLASPVFPQKLNRPISKELADFLYLANQHFPGAVQIVDLYHARQHLWELSAKLFPHDERGRKRWTAAHASWTFARWGAESPENYREEL